MDNKLRFHAQLPGFSSQIHLHVGMVMPNGSFALMQGPTFEVHDVNMVMPEEPSFKMSREDAQHLMDELFRIGIRPSDGTGSAGQMAATEKHLEDMRRLVFSRVP